ncbi:hypothetical protein V5N11_017459 [Cardamine amara subsp. amara]|uniref:DUF4408 domain-containing protein n=1 Tax=Cardamine amara subsp. amara TaxID=228776 RepID=A0ABD1ADH7_CARAN
MDHLLKPEFLMKLTKFVVVLIWALSLLVTHNFYIYRFTIQLVTHAVDKNYMFLLCNGLLVFVVKYSGLIVSSRPTDTNWSITDKTFDYRDFESYNMILELEHEKGTESFLAEEVTEEKEEIEDEDEPLADNIDREEECDLGDGFINEEEEENVRVLTSTEEEMNKKFDEFIRKMKEELRIEAKRHLILV